MPAKFSDLDLFFFFFKYYGSRYLIYRGYYMVARRYEISLPFECMVIGTHIPERETSIRSSHGVFTDYFVFRTVLARILNIF